LRRGPARQFVLSNAQGFENCFAPMRAAFPLSGSSQRLPTILGPETDRRSGDR
jgi:hypothetical protein